MNGSLAMTHSPQKVKLRVLSTAPLCPSARPEMAGSVVFGIINGTVDRPLVAYLQQPQPVTPGLLSVTGPVDATEVFRFAAPCAEKRCLHFDGHDCQLARRIAAELPEVAQKPPVCAIRPRCRWWAQEGVEACIRCPQVITDNCAPSDRMRQVAMPERLEESNVL